MNQIPINHELLLNSDNEGILKDLLVKGTCYNCFWGSEYIVLNEKSFIENNLENIVEAMVKSRTILSPA